MNLLPYAIGLAVAGFWIYCLATEDRSETVCQPEDCEYCPFPCEGCTGKNK